MNITIAQIRIYANNPQKNFETMKRWIQSVEAEADVIVFPEMTVGGYFLGDRYSDSDTIDELLRYNELIRELSGNVGIIWGNVYREKGKIYNAAYFAYQKEWVKHESGYDDGFYLKHLLPNYGVFDDKRFFHPGHGEFSPFLFKDKRVSIQICEDLWDEMHDFSPTEMMMAYEPDVMINISTSPWIRGKESARLEQMLRQYLDIPFVYVNAAGMQNTGKNILLFDGGSRVVHKNKIYELNDNFAEDVETVNVEYIDTHRYLTEHKLYEGMLHGIRYFDEEMFPFKPNWIVGVSGGLDSSVSTAILVKALGASRVVSVNMPSRFNREVTKNNAYALAQKLKTRHLNISIEDMIESTHFSLNRAGYECVEGLADENIQARLRGHTLMSIASLENGVVMNNGNKIEAALGYATLYGDAIGAIAVLGDLTKLEIGILAESINQLEGEEIVPNNLIPQQGSDAITWEFAPSAELAEGQFDPMKWGYHDVLIPYLMNHSVIEVMTMYQDGTIYDTDLGRYLKQYQLDRPHLFIQDLEWVLHAMQRNIYKRIQMPPILAISELAFGTDYRESQFALFETEAYRKLKESILKAS